jgi:hypothetical protein
MKKYILASASITLISLFCLAASFAANPSSGIVENKNKAKQPMDEQNASSAQQQSSKDDAQSFGQETARNFYNGQVNLDEANRRYQEMLSQGRQREYMRGYSTWRSQNLSYQQQEEENKKASGQQQEENKPEEGQ